MENRSITLPFLRNRFLWIFPLLFVVMLFAVVTRRAIR